MMDFELYTSEVDWLVEAVKVVEKQNFYDVYNYQKVYFDRISDLQLMLINFGYDVSLVGSCLLNAYRDQGVCLPPARLFTVFAYVDELSFEHNPVHAQNFLNLCLEFFDKDEVLYLRPKRSYPSCVEVGSAVWISKISYTSISGDGFKFNIGIRGFDDFPVHALEICRYTTVSKELQQKYAYLKNNVADTGSVCGYSAKDGNQVSNIVYRINKDWLLNRSRVFLYNSPFWTVGENYIESYLESRYGSDWNIPITDDMQWRAKQNILQSVKI